MSAERKKLLWISISALVFIAIMCAAGFLLFSPKKGSAQAPATIGNSAPPKAQDPQDYLSAPPASPSLEQPKSQDGNVIVVYGDKPTLPAASAPNAANAAPQAEPPAAESTTAGKETASADNGTQSGSAASSAPAAPAKKTLSAKNATKGAVTTKSVASKPFAKPVILKADEYWIQAGSFASRGRADELKQGLAEKGLASLISINDASGKSLYRVRIGPYVSEPEAKDWLAKIKDLDGCAAAYVLKSSAKKSK
jgi:cell division septation protein DedD